MISPQRLAEIREFADRDVLDLVEPEEMYFFLELHAVAADLNQALHEITNQAYYSGLHREALAAYAALTKEDS